MFRLPLLAVVLGLFCTVLQAEPFRTVDVVTGEWPPYSTSRTAEQGLATAIVTAVLNDMGYQPDVAFVPFYLGYELARTGSVSGTYPYFKTEARKRDFLYSEPLLEVDTVLFYRPDRIANPDGLDEPEDLRQYKVGRVKGYSYGEALDAALTDAEAFASELTAFRLLVNGELDIVPAAEEVGRSLLRQYFFDTTGIEILPSFRWRDSVHFIVGRGDEESAAFLDSFNRSLERIRVEGTHQTIIDRHRSGVGRQYLVRLYGTDSFPLVLGRDAPDAQEAYVIPQGTRAVVIEWSPRFLTKGGIKMYDEMFRRTRVRLIEGPLRDRVLYVDNIYISIE